MIIIFSKSVFFMKNVKVFILWDTERVIWEVENLEDIQNMKA